MIWVISTHWSCCINTSCQMKVTDRNESWVVCKQIESSGSILKRRQSLKLDETEPIQIFLFLSVKKAQRFEGSTAEPPNENELIWCTLLLWNLCTHIFAFLHQNFGLDPVQCATALNLNKHTLNPHTSYSCVHFYSRLTDFFFFFARFLEAWLLKFTLFVIHDSAIWQ